MGGIIGGVVRAASRVMYRVLSPSLCTRCANSRLGRAVGNLIAPQGDAIYRCDHGIRLLLSRRDAMASGIAHMGCTNPLETKLVLDHLKPGDTMVEVGTYKDGWLALVGSGAVGSSGRVICFEPIPEYCEAFRKNIGLNGRTNIAVEPMAVSDKTGTASFSLRSGNSSMVLEHEQSGGCVTVPTITLDGYLREHGISKLDFAVIDAEGAESLVLEGGRESLSKASYILLEVIDAFCRQAGSSENELVAKVVSMGFDPFVITRGGLVGWRPGMHSETMNMFFIHKTEPRDERR